MLLAFQVQNSDVHQRAFSKLYYMESLQKSILQP